MSPHIFDPLVGHFVSEEHRRIAEIINDYDSTLNLVWIPPNLREFDEEFPFAIQHSPSNLKSYIVRKLRESDVNPELVAWLWMNDVARNGDAPLQRLKAIEDAREVLRLKANLEASEEANDLASSIIKGKNYYRHNGKVYS
jgi:hypothetical protein